MPYVNYSLWDRLFPTPAFLKRTYIWDLYQMGLPGGSDG